MQKKILAVGFCMSLCLTHAWSRDEKLVLATEPNSASLQMQAVIAFKAGNYSRAAEIYESLAAQQKDNPDIYKDLMWAYWNTGNMEKTIAAAKRVLALSPADNEASNLIGQAYQTLGNSAKATESFRKVVNSNPYNLSAKLSLVKLALQSGNEKEAESLLRDIERMAPESDSIKQKLFSFWKQLARLYIEKNQQDKALEIYHQLIGVEDTSGHVKITLARLYAEQKKYDMAISLLKKTLDEAPDAKAVYPKIANVLFLKREYKASADMWATAIAAFPDKSDYKYKHALAIYYTGDYKSAMDELDGLRQDPDVGRRALDFMVDDLCSQGKFGEAASLLAETLFTSDYIVEDLRRFIRLADCYNRIGKYRKAMSVLDKAIAHHPGDGAVISMQAAVQMEAGHPHRALTYMNEILRRNPGASNILYAMTDAYEEVGYHQKTIDTMELYRKLDPTNPYVLLREAGLLFNMDRIRLAKSMLEDWLNENKDETVLPVLLYHGLTPNPHDGMLAHAYHHSVAMFESHIRALKEHGFTAVTVPQVAAWYAHKGELPKNPVLITFDDGRMDSFRYADPILEKYGMKATMFVICQNAEKNLPNYANWDELRHYQKNGRWDMQSHTDRGHSYITIDKDGYKGLFLVNKKWLEDQGRLENRQEWIGRIGTDHESSKSKMQDELNVYPVGFAFPESDFGQIEIPNGKFSPDINMSAARNYYDLAFTSDEIGLNVRSRAPHFLKRIVPPQAWTGEDLIRHITDGNPANRMRTSLLHNSLWTGHIRESFHWLDELKSHNASEHLVWKERARIYASRGNMKMAENFQSKSVDALGNDANDNHERDVISQQKKPHYNAQGIYFDDKDGRKNWTFEHSLKSGSIGSFKLRAIQRFGRFEEKNSKNVDESGLGAGFQWAAGLYHGISAQAVQHNFSGDAENMYSAKGGIMSQWTDNVWSNFELSRSPLFYAKALNAHVHMKTADANVMYEKDNQWDANVEGHFSNYSDGNNQSVGKVTASRSLSSGPVPRLLSRFTAISNEHVSPFYYSPLQLLEGDLGLMHTISIFNPYKLTLTYLPGIAKETGHGSRFVQNFKVGLACHWSDRTTLTIEGAYDETPTYHSREGNVIFEHHFGGKPGNAIQQTGHGDLPEGQQGAGEIGEY